MSVVQSYHSNRRHYGVSAVWTAPLGTVTSAYVPAGTASAFTVGTAPTNVPGNVAWLPLGWTDGGYDLTFTIKTEEDDAAESYDPVAYPLVGRAAVLKASLKQANLTNLRLSLNAPTTSVNQPPGPSTTATLTPPAPGSEVRNQYLLVSQEGNFAVVIYRALNTGAVSLMFQKGAKGLSVPLELNVEVVDSSISPAPYHIHTIGTAFAETLNTD
jgi:hypothetical protein